MQDMEGTPGQTPAHEKSHSVWNMTKQPRDKPKKHIFNHVTQFHIPFILPDLN
jgi:hypothetical protein